ncbi:hypothetical protein SNARM312S_06446 [Streptomyces narbonensis]
MAECTAYRSAVPRGAPVPTASAPRTRRPLPRDWSSTRSSVPPTTALAGAGRSRSRSTSGVSRAARRVAHSGETATTVPEVSYSAAQPSTCAASRVTTASGPSASAARVSSRWASKPAVTARYWSAEMAAETALLIARNGVLRGTSRSGRCSSRAASSRAGGISS